MNGHRLVQPLRLFGKADVFKNIPDTNRLVSGQFLLAGGTSCDDCGIAQLSYSFIQEFYSVLLHLVPSCPIADSAAASQHQCHTAFQPLAQIQIRSPHGSRRNGRGLASGEEYIFAGIKAWLFAAEEGFVIGENHIHQRKFMDRQRHFICVDHVLPGHVANFCHVITVGTENLALTAQAAGIDGTVHHMVAHNDGNIVVNFPGQNSGEFIEVLQECTAFDALVTVALDAPSCLGNGCFPVRNGDPFGRRYPFQIGIQPGLHTAFVTTGVTGIQVLCQPVSRKGCFLGTECRTKNTVSLAGNQVIIPAYHHRFIHRNTWEKLLRNGPGCADQIKLPRSFSVGCCRVSIPFKLDIDFFQIPGAGFLGINLQTGHTGSDQLRRIGLGAIHGYGVHLLGKFTGQEERKQVSAIDCHFFGFLPQQTPLLCPLAKVQSSRFQIPDGDSLTQSAEFALTLTGSFTSGGENIRERCDFFIQLQGF